jgi:folate-binding Fe-S cluster repair protein YgfZ
MLRNYRGCLSFVIAKSDEWCHFFASILADETGRTHASMLPIRHAAQIATLTAPYDPGADKRYVFRSKVSIEAVSRLPLQVIVL